MLNLKQLSGRFLLQRYEKSIWIMIIIRSLGMFGFAVWGPYLMLFLNASYGMSLTLAGLIVALANLGGAVSQVLGGAFTDKFGRRRSILLFFGLNVVFNIAITAIIGAGGPAWFFALIYIISGFSNGMAQPATAAVITDLAPRENLTEAYGLSQLGLNVGWIVAPLLGGFMYSRLSFAYLFAATIPTGVLAFVLAWTSVRDSFTGSREKMGLKQMFSAGADRALLTYVLLNFLVWTVYAQITNAYSVFTVERLGFSTTDFGWLMTVNGLLLVVFQYPVTNFVERRLGDKTAIVLGSVLIGAGYLVMSWITSFSWSILAITLFSMGELLFMPSLSSSVGRLAGEEQRGRYMGLLGTSSGLGLTMAPVLGGALLDASNGNALAMWGPISAITFLAALGFLRWFRAYKGRVG